MDEDALQALLREAVGETVAEVLQTLLHLDREASCGNTVVPGTAITPEPWRRALAG
jgi:hypothetical protein